MQFLVLSLSYKLCRVKKNRHRMDPYLPSSLKAETRSTWGQGVRCRITNNGKLTSNWCSFLQDGEIKAELFHFLDDKIVQVTSMTLPCLISVIKGANTLKNLEQFGRIDSLLL